MVGTQGAGSRRGGTPAAVDAAAVPELLTIHVDLPAPEPVEPDPAADVEHGVLEASAATPAETDTPATGITSVEVVPALVFAAEEQAERARLALERAERIARGETVDEPGPPPLPEVVAPQSRHGRRFEKEPEPIAFEPIAPLVGDAPAPRGFWPEFVYGITLTLVNIGDSAAVRAEQAMDARIQSPTDAAAHFVPVLSRQGGIGATTVTALLGMALADVRDDGVLAIDAHPDRGTLAERIDRADADDEHDGAAASTVRDVVNRAPRIRSDDDMAAHVLHDRTSLDVLGSDDDPTAPHAFDRHDYNVVADVAGRFYGTVLTDGAAGVREPIMREALQRADVLVLVSGGSPDEARLAAEALDWLEANDRAELVAGAVVALNTATPGTALDRLDEIDAHFRSRVRAVVRIPYDEELAAGTPIRFGALRPYTREAARDLAAAVVAGLPAAPAEQTGATDPTDRRAALPAAPAHESIDE